MKNFAKALVFLGWYCLSFSNLDRLDSALNALYYANPPVPSYILTPFNSSLRVVQCGTGNQVCFITNVPQASESSIKATLKALGITDAMDCPS